MLVVEVKLWPHGDASQASTLGTATIENDGTGTDVLGSYKYTLEGGLPGRGGSPATKQGRACGYRRADSVWHLLARVFHSAIGSWNPVASLQCSFCDKADHEVVQLITGPKVVICNECVVLCNEILAEERAKPAKADATALRAEAGAQIAATLQAHESQS